MVCEVTTSMLRDVMSFYCEERRFPGTRTRYELARAARPDGFHATVLREETNRLRAARDLALRWVEGAPPFGPVRDAICKAMLATGFQRSEAAVDVLLPDGWEHIPLPRHVCVFVWAIYSLLHYDRLVVPTEELSSLVQVYEELFEVLI